MGILGAQKWQIFILKMISTVCVSLLFYSTSSKWQPSVARDTGNNILAFLYLLTIFSE